MFNLNLNLLRIRRKLNYNLLSISQTIKYSTKTIEFKTCGQLFDKLRQKYPKLYRKSPSNGLPVSVEYVDTIRGDLTLNDCKTIVAIHGIPGYHKHFVELIDYFDTENSKVRVIVPNMPDFALTRQSMSFWHSTQERSQFIRDFLHALNVRQIDCLVSHSAGIHPISMLWTNPQELTIKSIGLFCPQPLWLSKFFYNISKPFAKLAQNKWGIKLMDILRPHLIAHKAGYPMSYANVDEVLLTVMITEFLKQEELHKRLQFIKDNKIPTIVVYGEKDKLVLKSNFNQLLYDLGVNQKSVNYYSSDGLIEQSLNDSKDWIKVLIFRNGGHFAFAKYSDVVNRQIQRLLKV